MKSLNFIDSIANGGTILCLGAHSDDIEITDSPILGIMKI